MTVSNDPIDSYLMLLTVLVFGGKNSSEKNVSPGFSEPISSLIVDMIMVVSQIHNWLGRKEILSVTQNFNLQ